MLEMENQDVLVTFCTAICSIFWCADVVLFFSSSGNQPPYFLSDVLPAGGVLSMGVVANARTNEARAAANDAAPVAPNVLNDVLAAGGSLSMGVVENTKINEA